LLYNTEQPVPISLDFFQGIKIPERVAFQTMIFRYDKKSGAREYFKVAQLLK
jgi:hypothetical protein